MVRFRVAAIVLLLVAFAACSDSSGPGETNVIGQDFPLFEVGMSQLPVLDRTSLFGARLMITAGTLRVLNRDSVLFVTHAEYWDSPNPTVITPVSPESLKVAYTRRADTLLVPFTNGPNGASTDTIVVMNGFLRASRFRAHREGAFQRRDYAYLTR
jgi:hypothetical protein